MSFETDLSFIDNSLYVKLHKYQEVAFDTINMSNGYSYEHVSFTVINQFTLYRNHKSCNFIDIIEDIRDKVFTFNEYKQMILNGHEQIKLLNA